MKDINCKEATSGDIPDIPILNRILYAEEVKRKRRCHGCDRTLMKGELHIAYYEYSKKFQTHTRYNICEKCLLTRYKELKKENGKRGFSSRNKRNRKVNFHGKLKS